MPSLAWHDQAACVGHDPELWFATPPVQAQEICQSCPVKATCKEWADYAQVTHGVWGGVERSLPPQGRRRPVPPHGTEARAKWDQRRGIEPCQECRDAQAYARAARKYRRHPTAAAKVCRMCGETKPAAEFHTKAGVRDGLSTYCKECNRERWQSWYQTVGRKRRGRA